MNQDECAFLPRRDTENFGDRKKERDAAARIDAEITASLREFEEQVERRMAFENLLACVRSRTDLLRRTAGHAGWVRPAFLIKRLQNLAARQHHWIRPCQDWQPTGTSLRPIFRSLATHLFAIYPVPHFLDSVWDLPTGPEGFRQQSWYIRLARGATVRHLNIPLTLTRRMEHYVRQAPDHFIVYQALRYGETLGLGGTEVLAREIATGRLGREIEYPQFWRTVLLFFVNHPEMNLEQVNPVIDFIHHTKFAGEELLTEHGAENRVAPWPSFSMEGRTPTSMLRLASAWHLELSNKRHSHRFCWARSDIQGYRFLEKHCGEEGDRHWTIQELLQSDSLYAEGKAMRHCVYTYAQRCQRGETTIWSLRLRVRDHEKRIATIEVDPRTRSIVQARAKCNLRPGIRSLEIIGKWADWAGLRCNLGL